MHLYRQHYKGMEQEGEKNPLHPLVAFVMSSEIEILVCTFFKNLFHSSVTSTEEPNWSSGKPNNFLHLNTNYDE